MCDYKVVVMGISSGGFKVLHALLPLFPADFPLPILVVQHRQPDSDNYFVNSLNEVSKVNVKEADDKEITASGVVYFAPGGYHLLLEKDMSLSLSVDDHVSYARPSIDVLFESASMAVKEGVVGVIMTGANCDGTNGMKVIKKGGGVNIAQNPESAESVVMPASAIQGGSVDFIKMIEDIPDFIMNLTEHLYGK
ncbi:MAG: chemotaxis protein CheB [Desulfotalea sp.]